MAGHPAVSRLVARLDQTPKTLDILHLTHDGRGVARWPEGHPQAGKAVFVAGALPGETVSVQQTARSKQFDEAKTLDVLVPSPDRVQPRCPHFGTCGGCVLQHLAEDRQITYKQQVLLDNLQRIGHVAPAAVLPPLRGEAWGYRRKGRFSVRRVEKKDKTLVGFREQDPRFVADISECHVVVPQLGTKVAALGALVDGLDARRDIPQIEFIAGDAATALVVRHLQPLSEADKTKLAAFGEAHGFALFLQPGGLDSVHPLGDDVALSFRLPQWDVELQFRPLDFIQVNARLNEAMIARALDLLDVQPGERVLDLFCGLGNFTLPIARSGARVVGVEGLKELTRRAEENAAANGLAANVSFGVANLFECTPKSLGALGHFDKMLIDPPREGAVEVVKALGEDSPGRIVYVSCNPSTLARDAAILVHQKGYRFSGAGIVNMFPHTSHVESIALFEKA